MMTWARVVLFDSRAVFALPVRLVGSIGSSGEKLYNYNGGWVDSVCPVGYGQVS